MANRKERRLLKKEKQGDEIPVGSFSDIAFLLIIFFLLMTTLVQTKGTEIQMPAGEQGEQEESEETPTVTIRDKEVFWNKDDKLPDADPFPELRKRLAELELHDAEGEEKVVMLETSGAVPYQIYFETLTAIAQAGGVVGIVREEESE